MDGAGAGEVEGHRGIGAGTVISIRAAIGAPSSSRLDRLVAGRRQPRQGGPQAVLGAGLERFHVARHRLAAMLAGERLQRFHPPVVGRHGSAQVGQVLLHGPGREGGVEEQAARFVPAGTAPPHQVRGRDHHPLLAQPPRARGHRARADPPDLGMVGAAGDVAEERPFLLAFKHRGHHRHVRQVGAAEAGVVGHHHVAGRHGDRLAQAAHAEAERPEVDGDVRRVDHQLAGRIEQGAGEVEPLLDVGGDGGALEPLPHLPGDRGEAVSEQLELDGLGTAIVDRDRMASSRRILIREVLGLRPHPLSPSPEGEGGPAPGTGRPGRRSFRPGAGRARADPAGAARGRCQRGSCPAAAARRERTSCRCADLLNWT